MIIDLNTDEREVLVHLVDQALREIGPEIRHTMTSSYKDDLKEQRRVLKALHARLAAGCAADPTAPVAEFAPRDQAPGTA